MPDADATATEPDVERPWPRWTEYVDVDALVPDERNPKRHDDAGLDDSLRRFGYTEQVMVDERTGKLVSGHGRRELVLRARAHGEAPPDGIVVDAEGRWLLPVGRGWSSKDDDDAFAYLVAANRWVEKGGWYDEALVSGLQALEQTEAGYAGVGYNHDDVNLMLAEIAKRNPAPPDEFRQFDENIPTEHTCPRCGYQYSSGTQ